MLSPFVGADLRLFVLPVISTTELPFSTERLRLIQTWRQHGDLAGEQEFIVANLRLRSSIWPALCDLVPWTGRRTASRVQPDTHICFAAAIVRLQFGPKEQSARTQISCPFVSLPPRVML